MSVLQIERAAPLGVAKLWRLGEFATHWLLDGLSRARCLSVERRVRRAVSTLPDRMLRDVGLARDGTATDPVTALIRPFEDELTMGRVCRARRRNLAR